MGNATGEMHVSELLIYADGAVTGNPGPAGVGVVICDADGNVLLTFSKPIGVATNNVAEYHALITALEVAQRYNPTRVVIHCDSELIVNQVNGGYTVRSPQLLALHNKVLELRQRLPHCIIKYIPSAQNKRAHTLAQTAALKSQVQGL